MRDADFYRALLTLVTGAPIVRVAIEIYLQSTTYKVSTNWGVLLTWITVRGWIVWYTLRTLGDTSTVFFLDQTAMTILYFQIGSACIFVIWDLVVLRNRLPETSIYKALLWTDSIWILLILLAFIL